MVEHALYAQAKCVAPEAMYQLDQRRAPRPRGRALCMNIPQYKFRGARVGLHHAENIVIFHAPLVDLHPGEDHAFLEQVFGIGAIRILGADIIPVRLVAGITDQLPVFHEHRHHHCRVLGMGTRAIRHVIEQDISGFQRFNPTDTFNGSFDTEVHGAQKHG